MQQGGMGGGMGRMGGGMGRMGDMGGGMSPEQMQQARAQRMQAWLLNIDANHNGQIDPEEAQGPNGAMLDRMLRGSGVEPKYPMPLSKVQEAMNNRFNNGMQGNQTPASDKSADESKPADTTVAPLVPGFGVSLVKQSPVLGFGLPGADKSNNAKKAGTSSDASTASASSTAPAATLDERFRKYAKALLDENDTNKNGKLEKDEWTQMKRKYWAADKNHDDIITLDELTEFIAADSGSGPKQSSGGATAASPNASTGSNTVAMQTKSGKPNAYRLRTPAERLPEGLPDWFARKDADGDGQVSLFEYTNGECTEAKVQEFMRYDLNGDGIITPQECLKVEKKK
jgi:Ca2+-binding EF-hand superfamily protein